MQTLADKIANLLHGGMADEVVARRLGCTKTYIRVVRQRRLTAVDRERERQRKRAFTRYWADPEKARAKCQLYRATMREAVAVAACRGGDKPEERQV